MKTKSDKRKTYMKPAMQVYELQYRTHLLQMSAQGGFNDIDDYDVDPNNPFNN